MSCPPGESWVVRRQISLTTRTHWAADAPLVSRVGNDPDGSEALEQLKRLGLTTECIEIDPTLRTGTVTVEIRSGGQPHYTIQENVAWDALAGEQRARAVVANAEAVCFGTLAQRSPRSRETIRSLLGLAPSSALRILDVNLRAPYVFKDVILDSLRLVNALKLNETELPELAQFLEIPREPRAFMKAITDLFRLRLVAFTRGAAGSLLFANGEISEEPSPATHVVDTIGAGDSFTAAMALGFLAKWPLKQIHRRAAEVAAFVCSQAGATPDLPEQLAAPFRHTPGNSTC